MWKIIHLNSGHTLITEDNIDLTKPVITANVLDHETSIALHAISGELLENVFYPMTYRPPIRRTEYRVANSERIRAFLSAVYGQINVYGVTNRVSIPLGSVDYVEDYVPTAVEDEEEDGYGGAYRNAIHGEGC